MNYSHIVGLRMQRGTECLDFWLTQYERLLTPMVNGDVLQVIYSAHTNMIKRPSLKHFEVLKVIGKGGFSKVLQVRKRDTGMLYAMKTTNTQYVVHKNKVGQLRIERSILQSLNHPFLINMHYAFQTVYIYIYIYIHYSLRSTICTSYLIYVLEENSFSI